MSVHSRLPTLNLNHEEGHRLTRPYTDSKGQISALSWEPADLRGLSNRNASLSTIGFRGRGSGNVIELHRPVSGPLLPETSAFPAPQGRPHCFSPATLDPRRGCFQFRESWKECRLLLPLVPLLARGFCNRQELPGG